MIKQKAIRIFKISAGLPSKQLKFIVKIVRILSLRLSEDGFEIEKIRYLHVKTEKCFFENYILKGVVDVKILDDFTIAKLLSSSDEKAHDFRVNLAFYLYFCCGRIELVRFLKNLKIGTKI